MSSSAPTGEQAYRGPALAGAMLASLAYGIFLSLTCTCLYLFLRRTRSFALLIYAAAVLASTSLFLIAEWLATLDFLKDHNKPQWRFLDPDGSRWYHTARNTSILSTIFLTECLMMWRCLVVWENVKLILVLPVLLLIASIVLSILRLCDISGRAPAAITISTLSLALTLLIGGRMLWRRLGPVATLVDSGALHTAAVLATFVLVGIAGNDTLAVGMPLFAGIMSAAPIMIVLRCALGRAEAFPASSPEIVLSPTGMHAASASQTSLYPIKGRPESTALTMSPNGGLNPVLLAELRRGRGASTSTYRESV